LNITLINAEGCSLLGLPKEEILAGTGMILCLKGQGAFRENGKKHL
jgi:hypothetical protein